MSGVLGVVFLITVAFYPAYPAQSDDTGNTEVRQKFEDPTIVLDMVLWKALKTKHPAQLMATVIRYIKRELSQKLKCANLHRLVDQPKPRLIRDFCGNISMLLVTSGGVVVQDWFTIASPYEKWPIWIHFLVFKLPFSYDCTESYMMVGKRVYCGTIPPWDLYTHSSKVDVIVKYKAPDRWSLAVIVLKFQLYNMKYMHPSHSTPHTLTLVNNSCENTWKCTPVPRTQHVSLPANQFYIIRHGGLVYEFQVTALQDHVVIIEVEKQSEQNTITVFDGPDSNVPDANVHLGKWITTAFCAYIRAVLKDFVKAVIINFESVEYHESPLVSQANLMCDMTTVEASTSKTKLSVVGNKIGPVPQLCILNLKPSNTSIAYVHVRMPVLKVKTGPGCSTAGVVFIDRQDPPYYSRPICSASSTVRFTSRGRALRLVFYNFWQEQFRAVITVEKTECRGINAECGQLLNWDRDTMGKGQADILLSKCGHLFILPNAPETSTCNVAVSSGVGRSAAFTLDTYFPMSNNQSDKLSIDIYPPTTTSWRTQLPGTRSHLVGQSQLVSTVYKLEFNLTTVANYTRGGYFMDIERRECVEMQIISKDAAPAKLSPFLFDNCGTIAVAFQYHETRFFIMYLWTNYFDLAVAVTDGPCTHNVGMNITDLDAMQQPLYIWNNVLPMMRWKSSAPFLQVTMHMELNETCGLNFTFKSHKAKTVQVLSSGDDCIVKSPIPLPGKDQTIIYTLRRPVEATWEAAEKDCARLGASLFSPYSEKHLSQLLQLVDGLIIKTTPCVRLAAELWTAPAMFIGLRRSKHGDIRWQHDRSVHSMAWWHHMYNSSLYPEVLFNNMYYSPTKLIFHDPFRPLVSRKFTLPALTSAKKLPARQVLSASKECILLVSYTTKQAPLWLPVSCSEPMSVPYVCEKVQFSSSFTELQKYPGVYCNNEYMLFEGSCYKLYSVPVDSKFWAQNICAEDEAKLYDKKTPNTLLKAWNYDKDSHGLIWGLHKGKAHSHLLCEMDSTPVSKKCGSGYFECPDKSCILNLFVCDGHPDCVNAEDERDCNDYNAAMAPSFYFSCPSDHGPDISLSLICNGHFDCEEAQDEDKALCTNHSFCSSTKRRCDGVVDCLDGRDERNCDYCSGFNCTGSVCINVGNLHFSPGWCRPSAYGVASDQICSAYGNDFSPCSPSDAHCFPRSKACLLQHDRWGGVLHCPTGAHLMNCAQMECPQRFKCHRSYCIQMSKVCDGIKDCMHGEDESICGDQERCVGMVRCRLSSLCLTPDQLCDGHRDCPYADDEELCTKSWCPEGCSCSAHVLHCPHRFMHYLPLTLPTNLISLMLKSNKLFAYDFGEILRRFQALLFLDISYNAIIHIPAPIVQSPLTWLSLEGNKLFFVTNFDFSGMKNLQYINLQGNPLGWIGMHAFSLMHSLPELILSDLHIFHMAPYCISDMSSLVFVNVSNNRLRYLSSYVFSGAKMLRSIDLRNNPIAYISTLILDGAWYLEKIFLPDFKLCCLLKESISNRVHCLPETDPDNVFSSCEDLLSFPILRGSIWIFGISGILVNLFTIVWRRHTQKHTPFSLLVQHLGGADCLMGVYLLMIGSADSMYRDRYYLEEENWRRSPHCKIAGFVSMLSCEMSTFLLVLITIDRVAVAGLGRKGIGRKTVRSFLTSGWLVWIALSILPIVGMSYFGGHDYIKHGTCYLFNLSEGKTRGWEFTTAIFVTFNSFCVLFMIIGYSFVFISIQCKTADMTPTIALARRLSVVVATNCICWIPPISCGIVALSGHTVHPQIITWIAVLVLPINSTVNPFLYTLSITQKMRRMWSKKRERRDSEGEEIQQAVLNDEPEASTSGGTHVAHAGARPKTILLKINDTLI